MSSILKKLKNPKRTQVIVKNLVLDELIDKSILRELKRKFAKDGDLITTSIRFFIVPEREKEKPVKSVDAIVLEHQSEGHFKNKVAVITSSDSLLLEKFLKK